MGVPFCATTDLGAWIATVGLLHRFRTWAQSISTLPHLDLICAQEVFSWRTGPASSLLLRPAWEKLSLLPLGSRFPSPSLADRTLLWLVIVLHVCTMLTCFAESFFFGWRGLVWAQADWLEPALGEWHMRRAELASPRCGVATLFAWAIALLIAGLGSCLWPGLDLMQTVVVLPLVFSFSALHLALHLNLLVHVWLSPRVLPLTHPSALQLGLDAFLAWSLVGGTIGILTLVPGLTAAFVACASSVVVLAVALPSAQLPCRLNAGSLEPFSSKRLLIVSDLVCMDLQVSSP